jgi:hypothetical protein
MKGPGRRPRTFTGDQTIVTGPLGDPSHVSRTRLFKRRDGVPIVLVRLVTPDRAARVPKEARRIEHVLPSGVGRRPASKPDAYPGNLTHLMSP